MRIVYLGSSTTSKEILNHLIDKNYTIVLVVTQPDKKGGRGNKLLPTPVKLLSIEKKIPVLTPEDPNSNDTIKEISRYNPELFFLCAYAKLLRKDLLNLPDKGAVNLHFSLLPELRGAAPIQRAIMKGLKRTGVTTFFMNESLDKGDIILQKSLQIKDFETAGELEKRLIELAKEVATRTIETISKGSVKTIKQDENKKSYAKKILKEERKIDWSWIASDIVKKINGLSPKPGSFTHFKGKRIILLKSKIGDTMVGKPGTIVLRNGLEVVAGDKKTVIIELLKPEGKKVITAQDFINGFRIKDGETFI